MSGNHRDGCVDTKIMIIRKHKLEKLGIINKTGSG